MNIRDAQHMFSGVAVFTAAAAAAECFDKNQY